MKRILASMIAIFALLSLGGAAYADTAVSFSEGYGFGESLMESDQYTENGVLAGETSQQSVAPDFEGEFYAQLTDSQKLFYSALSEIRISDIVDVASDSKGLRRIKLNIQGVNGLQLSGSFSGDAAEFFPTDESAEKTARIYTDMLAAITAFRMDRPDAIWVSKISYGFTWRKANSSTAIVTSSVFAFSLRFIGEEEVMWNKQNEVVAQLAAQIDENADRYTKVKAVHDMLAGLSTYLSSSVTDERILNASHTPYSALLGDDEYEPVCDGYSTAFKMICDKLEIPCVTVISEDHMWNNVKMDDGRWYNVDLTWDDNATQLTHNYFLIGSYTKVNDKVFSEDKTHVELNPYVKPEGNYDVEFRYPTKYTEAYVYSGGPYDGEVKESITYPDVRVGDWFYYSVTKATELSVFMGDSNGMFNPQEGITRAEFLQALVNCLGEDTTGYSSSRFSDVNAGDWFMPAVAWAEENGVLSGYEDGTFKPNNKISREEMCSIFMRVSGGNSQDNKTFSDDADISDWARGAVYYCKSKGLVVGYQNEFNPKGITLRCEAAAVFVRFAAVRAVE